MPEARIVHDEGRTRDHGWSPRVAAHFHRGAYLYWRNHHAPQAWNPARWAAAGLLATRAAAVMAARPRSAGPRPTPSADHVVPNDRPTTATSRRPIRSDPAAPPPSPNRAGEPVTLRLFFRRYWRIFLVALLGALVAFGASFAVTPTYTSSTRMLIQAAPRR